MAQYISLDSWLFCPTVTWVEKAKVGFTFEVLASFAFLTFPCQPTFLKGENDAFHFGSEVWALLTHSIFPWVLTSHCHGRKNYFFKLPIENFFGLRIPDECLYPI